MRETAVSGGTARPALAAEICADLGVRCAASSGRPAVLPGCLPAKTRMQPALVRARVRRSRFCPVVERRVPYQRALRPPARGASGWSSSATARPTWVSITP